jgi:hypothetical protein
MGQNRDSHPFNKSRYLSPEDYAAYKKSIRESDQRIADARRIAGEEPRDLDEGPRCSCEHAKRGIEAFWQLVYEQPCEVHGR